MRAKTLMGLQPFEVRFFFGEKVTKLALEPEEVIQKYSNFT